MPYIIGLISGGAIVLLIIGVFKLMALIAGGLSKNDTQFFLVFFIQLFLLIGFIAFAIDFNLDYRSWR